MASDRSELECFVLGLVWQFGPVSAYGVRRAMQASPNRQWSASAGAIYPVLRRLGAEGFLASADQHQGRRRRTEYRITPAGQAVLREWIGPPMGPEVVTVTYDPLRTRARFLRLLGPADRAAWVAAALGVLDEVERLVEAWDEDLGSDPFLASVTRNARLETRARRRWLEDLGALLVNQDTGVRQEQGESR